MKDAIQIILKGIPKYLMNAVEILSAPRLKIPALITGDDQFATGAWSFLGISLVIIELLRISIKGGNQDIWKAMVADSIWIASFLMLFIVSTLISLRLVTRRLHIPTVSATCIYLYSACLVAWNAFLVLRRALQNGIPCQRIISEYGPGLISCNSEGDLMVLWKGALVITELLTTGFGLLGVLWFLWAWFVWSPVLGISRKRCILSLCIFLVVMPFIGTIGLFVRFGI